MSGGSRSPLPLLALLVTAAGAAPLDAQWRVDAQAGRLQYEVSPEATTPSLGFGLSRQGTFFDFGVSAGVPLSAEEPVWGAIFGSRRFVGRGPVRFGIDLAGQAFGYRIEPRDTLSALPRLPTDEDAFTGWGASIEAMPLIAGEAGAFALEARAGGVHFLTRADGADGFDRTAFLADATVAATPVPALTVRLEGAAARVTEGTYPYAGIGVSWSPSVTLWGSVGRWLSDDIPTTAWSAGVWLPLGERLALQISGRHDPLDPVYATPARTSWGAGLSLRLGPGGASVPEPVPAAYEAGVATIALDADDVDGVPSIAGDFNDWTPVRMTRRGDAWIHQVALRPGVYNYAFVDEDGNWFVPRDTPGRRADGMGGHVAVLVVEE